MVWQGNQAIAEGAIAAGVRFFAGYPITPATEIAEYMARRLPEVGGVFIQMEDEIASMGAVIGASLAGWKAMTATSGPGFSLMQENIGLAAMMEVPCVVADVMRVGPATGMATLPAQQDVMQARFGTHGERSAVAFCPSSVRDCYYLTARAVAVSELLRTPVVILSDAAVGHMTEAFDLDDEVELVHRRQPDFPPGAREFLPYEPGPDGIPPMPPFGAGYAWHAEGSTHNEQGDLAAADHGAAARLHPRLARKADKLGDSVSFYSLLYTEGAEVLVVSYGISARCSAAVVHSCRKRGFPVGMVTLKTLWPFPEGLVRRVASSVRAIVVAELNILGQVYHEVRRSVPDSVQVHHVGRADGRILTQDEIANAIREVL